MTLKRTFINRGKSEMTLDQLKPNGVYAVEHILPAETAAEYGVKQEQWGLIVLDSLKHIRRTWNIQKHDAWIDTHMSIDDLGRVHIWKASVMEQEFAVTSDTLNSQIAKAKSLRIQLESQQNLVSYYEHNYWHRIADRIATFFSV